MDREPRSSGWPVCAAGGAPPRPGQAQVARLTNEALRNTLMSFMVGCGLDESSAGRIGQELAEDHRDGIHTDELSDLLLAILPRCLNAAVATIYVSVPITSGRAYLQQRSREAAAGDGEGQARAAALKSNLARASITVERLRRSEAANVIDPSKLPDIPGWTQSGYHSFWSRVIAAYPQKIVFLDGWHYSVGCTREFADSIRFGLAAFTESLAELDADTGIELVRAALTEYARAQISDTELRTSLEAVQVALAGLKMGRSPI